MAGFFIQLGGIGAFYNAGLSHYYLMVLRYGWTDERIAKRFEPWIHGASLLFPIGTAFAALGQDLYGPTSLGCWIATPQPRQCLTRDEISCTSGEHAMMYAWAYQGGPLFLLLIYIAYAMYLVYQKVQEVTHKAEKWTMQHASASQYSLDGDSSHDEARVVVESGVSSSDNLVEVNSVELPAIVTQKQHRGQRRATRAAERTREVAGQAILYVMAYLVTHMWAFIVYHIEVYAARVPGPLLIIENVSWPLQGFLNLFVFIRPQVQATQRKTPTLSYLQAVYVVLLGNEQARHAALQQHVSALQSASGREMPSLSSHVGVRSQSRGALSSENFESGENGESSKRQTLRWRKELVITTGKIRWMLHPVRRLMEDGDPNYVRPWKKSRIMHDSICSFFNEKSQNTATNRIMNKNARSFPIVENCSRALLPLVKQREWVEAILQHTRVRNGDWWRLNLSIVVHNRYEICTRCVHNKHTLLMLSLGAIFL